MAFEFTEQLTLELPKLETAEFFAQESLGDKHLFIDVASIHEGLTSNFTYYTAAELKNSLASWTQPYPKPVIQNHDAMSEPIGRIMGAAMAKELDGTPYIGLQAAIMDPVAMQKIADKRYLTGSVGGKADEALCSICNTDWGKASSPFEVPCEHQRGKLYKGKIAHINFNGLTWREYSFVSFPSDTRSGVRTTAMSQESDSITEYVNKVRFFSFGFNEPTVTEYVTDGPIDVLKAVAIEEAAPLYLGLKNAFIKATTEEETLTEENEMTVQEQKTSEETSTEEEAPVKEAEEENKETTVEEGHEVEVVEDKPTNESRLEDKKPVEVQRSVQEEQSSHLANYDAAEVAALRAQLDVMAAENERLKGLQRRELAEAIVAKKIGMGLIEVAEKDSLNEKLLARSLESLNDTLNDLNEMKLVVNPYEIPVVEDKTLTIENEKHEKQELVSEDAIVGLLASRLLGRSL